METGFVDLVLIVGAAVYVVVLNRRISRLEKKLTREEKKKNAE